MLSVPGSTSVAAYDSSTTSDSFCKDGRIVRVGDCALFKPTLDSLPLIGIIRQILDRKKENIRLAVNWIYRPAGLELRKGVLLEAAPNEVFFSFHKDEIPAASLLHPCKVAFLSKGGELPSRIASFVCRRVYDIENKCLWWLTDKHYIKEQQEEVHKLLDKTRLEMHGSMQSGGRSPKPLNVQTSNTQLKPGPDSVKNNDSTYSSLVKGKKREHGDSGSDLIKQDRISKPSVEDECSDNTLRSQIGKITERGGLVELEGVRKLVQLMQPEGAEMKIDLVGRTMLAEVISVTDNFECLGRFVQLRGLHLLDEWLQEVRRGKIGVGSSPKKSDKSVDEFILAVLRALEKLPVNLDSLQTSNVGKSVNYLRSHRNPEIQKKARSLVDIWKKRVEAEMNVIDAKSGLSRTVSLPSKTVPLEVSQVGVSRTGVSSEVVAKSSIQQPSAPKSPGVNNSPGEVLTKLPVACPSSSNKLSSGTSHHRKSSNGTSGSAASGVQKEPEKHQKVSPNGAKQQKLSDASHMDHGFNQRLIVRLPNTGRSPARCVSEGSVEERAVMSKASSSPSQSESQEHHNRISKVKSLSERDNYIINAEPCQIKDCAAETDNGHSSPAAAAALHDEQRSASENCEMLKESSKTTFSPENARESGKSFEASLSSINALIDSCIKFSEVSASALLGDDVGMNLLASVAAGEISKSDSSSPLRSGRSSPAAEDPCSGSEAKLKKLDANVAHVVGQMVDSSMNQDILEKSNRVLSTNQKTGSECSAPTKPADNSCSVPEGNHSEVTYDASVPLSSIHDTKEYTEDEGSNYKRNIGQREGSKSPLEEDEKINQADDSLQKNCVVPVVEAALKNVKVELKNPVDNEQSQRKQRQLAPVDGTTKTDLRSNSRDSLKTESLDEKANTVKTDGQEEKPNKDSITIAENNVVSSATHKMLKEVYVQATEPLLKTSGCKSDGVVSDGMDDRHASSVNTSSSSAVGSEKALKLDFDLNEGFPADDDSQEQHQNLLAPENSSAVNLSCPLPFPISSQSGSFPTSITVAAAAKGPFVHPEYLSRIKGELGWKGSAATSAFRPAEPRKILELPLNTSATLNVDGTTNKHVRAPLDIDLNVSDEKGLDDVVSPYTAKRLRTELRPCNHSAGPAGGFDFDLNSVGECPDTQQFPANNRLKVENISLLSRSSLPGGFSNGEMSISRNFDLNNGPGIDDVAATETAPLRQNIRTNAPFLQPVPAMTMNQTELGNMASWFPPAVNSHHSPITIPSFYSSRGEQCYPVVTAAGPQRILVPSVNGNNTSFNSEMFRGAVLQSSPAVVFPPTSTFPYPGYPFETSFPMASNHYMDSSSGGAICFPAIPSQLEGSTNVAPSHYPQPFIMSLPSSTASIGHESRKWGNQGLDLNAGPGSSDIPPAYRHVSVGSPAQVNKQQLHMYQMAGGGLKRKEPDGGWDIAADRYKHP